MSAAAFPPPTTSSSSPRRRASWGPSLHYSPDLASQKQLQPAALIVRYVTSAFDSWLQGIQLLPLASGISTACFLSPSYSSALLTCQLGYPSTEPNGMRTRLTAENFTHETMLPSSRVENSNPDQIKKATESHSSTCRRTKD